MKNLLIIICGLIFLYGSSNVHAQTAMINYNIKLGSSIEDEAIDGRLLLFFSKNDDREPRRQASDGVNTAQVYGQNVQKLKPGQTIRLNEDAFGYPLRHLNLLPSGEYYIQAVLNRYDDFNLSNGHTLSLPASWAAGQQFNDEPGNLYSQVLKVNIEANKSQDILIELTEIVPPVTKPQDTKYIKHIEIKSEKLSAFWGRDMFLGAHILLPHGFDEHPEAKYPLMVFHGHFPKDFGGWRSTPPDYSMEPDYSTRFNVRGYNITQQEEAYHFYQTWVSDTMPRFIIIEIQHANPYYDDSYAVNSANLGPYGDAITYELIPHIEKEFRGIGEGWARFLYGGSTGGWEALAAQVFYPDEYNGCFAACPDPVDFRAYTSVNIYKDKNAYFDEGPFKRIARPGHRDFLGHVQSHLIDQNHKELALGDHSRSGNQWDIWQAVYSPVGKDGYPAPIWNKKTGEINPDVALYWRDHYDLQHIMRRDWDELGPKLQGKIHVYCGDMDNYYLNNAVYLLEEFLAGTMYPHYDGEVDYGDRAEHCWNGDQENPNHISRLRYNSMYVPKIMKRIQESAPKDADLKSWRY